MRFSTAYRCVLIASVCLSPIVGRPAIAQTPPDQESSLLELTTRAFGDNSQVLVGQLPQLPVTLPMLESSRVVGSIVSNFGGENLPYYQVYLNVPRSAQQVQAAYREQLQAAGWQERVDSSRINSTGFLNSVLTAPSLTFCDESKQFAFNLRLEADTPSTTAVDISVMPAAVSVCSAETAQLVPGYTIPQLALAAPANSRIIQLNTAVSTDYWSSRARITSSIDRQALVTHYVSQLEQSGWTVQASETVGAMAWSFLTLEDEQGKVWQGLLTITASDEAADLYAASIFVFQ